MSHRLTARALALTTAVVLVSAATALAAGYGRGHFQGSTKPLGTGPSAPVEIQVKGSKVRVLEIGFTFNCGSSTAPLQRTFSTPFFKVHKGPAGGGATFNGQVTANEGGTADLSVALGLRQKSISGTTDATMDIEGLPCMKSSSLKANKD